MTRLRSLLFVSLLAGCTWDSGVALVADDVVITTPRPGTSMTAGYLQLANRSDRPIRITSVKSPQFARVEMHETIVSDGVARMRPIESLTVGPGETLRFEPGGRHLMLMQPDEPLGDVTLYFHADDAIVLTVHVESEDG